MSHVIVICPKHSSTDLLVWSANYDILNMVVGFKLSFCIDEQIVTLVKMTFLLHICLSVIVMEFCKGEFPKIIDLHGPCQ